MIPEVRIYVIETCKEIIRDRGEKITSEKIIEEFNKLVEGLDIPKVVTFEREFSVNNKTNS